MWHSQVFWCCGTHGIQQNVLQGMPPPFSAALYFYCTIGLAGWLFISWLFPQKPLNDCIYMHTCNQKTAVFDLGYMSVLLMVLHFKYTASILIWGSFLMHQLRIRHDKIYHKMKHFHVLLTHSNMWYDIMWDQKCYSGRQHWCSDSVDDNQSFS